MKTSIMLIFILIVSCKNNFKDNEYYLLTNNTTKFWYIDLKKKNPSNEWLTLWYFTNNNGYYRYLYNSNTKEIRILDNGDNIDSNKFYLIGKDSISLNKSSFPILKLSKDEFILKNIYSDSFFPEDSIVLKRCKTNNEKIFEDCDRVLQKIDSIRKNLITQE